MEPTPTPAANAPAGGVAAVPMPPTERIEAIDVVRGFALLGILLMNILAFGLPSQSYSDPTADGATQGIDFAFFLGVDFFSEGAMRALFSMLFGAGVVIFACGPRAKPIGVYYRRQLLLLAFGLFDALILLWAGDILVPYAVAGMLLYPLRNWRPKALFIAAGVVFAYLAAFYAVTAAGIVFLSEQAGAIEARLAAGEAVAAADRAVIAEWQSLKANFQPPPEAQARHALIYQGTYPESIAANAIEVGGLYAFAHPAVLLWDALACMLLGMALYKTSVLRGGLSLSFYKRLAVWGFLIGGAVNAFELWMAHASGFALVWVTGIEITNDIGRVAMALGYVGLVMIVCQSGALARARRALAATGRMALTNYILQSVLALIIFHAMGFGLWNELARWQLYLVVLGEWVVILAFSVWWLERRRFGPLEWLWRTLTYGRKPERP